MSMQKLITLKANFLGVLSISVLSSLATVFFTNFIGNEFPSAIEQAAHLEPMAMAPSGILDCEKGVYSPVQRLCVDQATFDAEMKRLFAALGLNTKAYENQ